MKDTSFLRQNIEKLVLAAAALVLLLVVAYFFVLNPFAVEHQGRTLAPTEFEERLETQVDRLETALEQSTVPEITIPDFAQVFTAAFNRAVTGTGSMLAILMEPGLPENLVPDDASGAEERYALPSPPPATELEARDGFAVLDPNALGGQARRAMIELIGDADPPDFRYVSVVGAFDFPAWEARLEEAGVPEGWRSYRRGVARVSLLRQRWDPEAGRWTDPVRIEPLPTQLAYGNERNFTREMARDVIVDIQQRQLEIVHPDFPAAERIDGGKSWLSPDIDAQLTTEDLVRLDEITRDIASNQRRMETLRRQLDMPEQPGARDRRDLRDPRMQDRGDFGEPPIPGDRRGMDRRTLDRRTQDRRMQDRREADSRFGDGAGSSANPRLNLLRRLQEETRELIAERRELLGEEAPEDEGESLDRDPRFPEDRYGEFTGRGGEPTAPRDPFDPRRGDPREDPRYPGQPGTQDPAEADREPSWFERQVRIWAHDVTVQPGETYRYKLIPGVVNPLFHEDRLPPEQREANLNRLVLEPTDAEIAQAPWSEPVSVDPVNQFFLVGGDANSGIAQVEVWRIYDGRWVVEEFSVRPGDKIGGAASIEGGNQLDLTLDVVLVDVKRSRFAGGNAVAALYTRPDGEGLQRRIDARDTGSDHYQRLKLQESAQQRIARGD